jgi:hypothetical protein
MLDNDGGFTTSVPSREAVEEEARQLDEITRLTHGGDSLAADMLRTLFAEVERLNAERFAVAKAGDTLVRGLRAEVERLNGEVDRLHVCRDSWQMETLRRREERDEARATVAEQGAALAELRKVASEFSSFMCEFASVDRKQTKRLCELGKRLDAAIASAQSREQENAT